MTNHSLKEIFLSQLVGADHISRIIGIGPPIALKAGVTYNKATQFTIGYPALYPVPIVKLDCNISNKSALPTIQSNGGG